MDAAAGLRYVVDEPVAVITLDRPEALNAFTFDMLQAFREAILDAVSDPRVVGIIVTGNGRGFCAGLDASAMTATTEGSPVTAAAHGHGRFAGMFSYLLEQPKPVIAAVNGIAAGGGFLLASMCDLRFASADASFVTVFTRRGLVGELGVTWTLPRAIGTGAALDLLWSSRPVNADEAHRLGLVERVVEPDRLLTVTKAYVQRLATEVAPTAIAETKRMVYEEAGMRIDEALTHAKRATEAAMVRPDAREGAAAFVQRRQPRFSRIPLTPPPAPDCQTIRKAEQ